MAKFTQQEKRNIKQYKYNGVCKSICYNFLWSPLSQFILKFIPIWVAPNLITVLANCIFYLAHIIVMLFTIPIPNWAALLAGISLAIYQILDNVDGKQARKTKSSSPLGMLIDHGMDSLTCTLMVITSYKIFSVQDKWIQVLSLVAIKFGFYSATMFQHQVGLFILGRINAVDQGIPLLYSLYILTYFTGVKFWYYTIYGKPLNFYLCMFLIVMVVIQQIELYYILKTKYSKSVRSFLKKMIPSTFSVLVTQFYQTYLLLSTQPFYIEIKYYCVYAFTFFIVKSINRLQLCHIIKNQDPQQYNKTFFFFNIFIWSYMVMNWFQMYILPPIIFGSILSSISFVAYLHYIICMVKNLASQLKIQIFRIPYKKDQ